MSQNAAAGHHAVWLDVDLGDVAANLALDEALLDAAHDGTHAHPIVRTWTARTPTVVLGSSSRIAAEVDLEACAALGVELVRRPSGGLTVLLGPGCLMWSVVVPHPHGPPPVDALHAAMLDPLAAALRAAGRPVERRGTSDLALVAGPVDRKVSGNALRVRRAAVLYHGTLLDAADLEVMSRVLRHPPREPGYRAGRRHADFLANLHLGHDRLVALVRSAHGADAAAADWPRERATALLAERYARDAWTRRL